LQFQPSRECDDLGRLNLREWSSVQVNDQDCCAGVQGGNKQKKPGARRGRREQRNEGKENRLCTNLYLYTGNATVKRFPVNLLSNGYVHYGTELSKQQDKKD
jgi:hypothetical protein